ncbi:MAG: Fur family transcriptional regulator [Muribaculaceae bacterium]
MDTKSKENTVKKAVEMLKKAGLRQSHQRIAILRFLMLNDIHPTADDIYNALKNEYPTMSLTTVYNTLKALSDAGAIEMLKIERENARFDFPKIPHSHFRCRSCGKILDISELPDILQYVPKGCYHIENVEVYFQGLCDECFNKNQ